MVQAKFSVSSRVPITNSFKSAGRDFYGGGAKIKKIVRYKHSIGSCIVRYVVRVGRTVWVAMVRVQLLPDSIVLMVNVVSDNDLLAAIT